jgi:amyloid beta (A4) precursor protein-binding family B protein 2 (Fe65-like)
VRRRQRRQRFIELDNGEKILFYRRRRSYPLKSETDKPIRFAVRSLGWVEIAEEDLTPERSSKAVNKCILDLSFGKNDLLDVVGRWGDVSVSAAAIRVRNFY